MFYNICKNFRIVQYKGNKKAEYIGYNSATGKEYLFNMATYLLIKYVNDNVLNSKSELYKCGRKYSFSSQELIDRLLEEKIIFENDRKEKNVNIVAFRKCKYPLTKLSIEITNACNLNCIHCYGKFGKTNNIQAYTFDDIVNLKHSLDILHTNNIALTGGEVLTNPDFETIALFFLENGFKLTIFTNGFNTKQLKKFLDKSTKYKYRISISCDGNEPVHNNIRGNKEAYENLLNTLNMLKKYSNVDVSISTTVMKNNIYVINELSEFLNENFAYAEYYKGIVLPSNDKDLEVIGFKVEEFNTLYQECPSVFDVPDVNKRLRCSGGVAGAALCADGILKICSAAPTDEKFIIGNIKELPLEYIWNHPNEYIRKYRLEKNVTQTECKKCKSRKNCKSKNCRLYAYAYYKNIKSASPIACYITKLNNKGRKDEQE